MIARCVNIKFQQLYQTPKKKKKKSVILQKLYYI